MTTLFLNISNVFSQCLQGSVTLTSQAQVDQFGIDYPNCMQFNGNLTINSTSAPVTDLSGLSSIETISGYLLIDNNDDLSNLTGFENLNEIAGRLIVRGNAILNSLSGLQNLTSVGGFLTISNNDKLVDLSGLENLTSITSLSIGDNKILENITALQNVNTINNGQLGISSNPSLTSLSGIENINDVGRLVIHSNAKITICHFDNICLALENDLNHYIRPNALGCNDETQILAGCQGIPVALPTTIINNSEPIIIDESETLNLTQSSTNYDSLLWNSGDGQTSTNNEVSFNYNNPGTYTVILEASNAYGTSTDSVIVSVIANNNLPNAVIDNTNGLMINQGGSINLTQSSINYNSVLWNSGDGQTSTDSQVTFTYNIPGTYTIILQATNDTGSDIASLTLFVNEQTPCFNPSLIDPNAICLGVVETVCGCNGQTYNSICDAASQLGISTFTMGDCADPYVENFTICAGEGVQLSRPNGFISNWSPFTGLSCTDCFNPIASPTTTTIYTLRTTVGDITTIAKFKVEVDQSCSFPTATIDGNNIITINKGETINLTQSSTNYDSLLWNSGDGQTSTDNQVAFTYNTVGTFTISLETTNSIGTDIANITVIVNETVIIDANCEGDTLVYTTPSIIPNAMYKKMKDWILFSGDNDTVKVQNGDTVTFKAGKYIEIKEDFEVEAGAEFLLDIEDCDGACVTNFNNLLGGDKIDKIYSMEITADGGYILAGSSDSSNSSDIADVNAGGLDYWIIKLDANGNTEWSNLLGDESFDTAYSVAQTADGNYIVNGKFVRDIKTIKLDVNGNEIWSNSYSGGDEFSYVRTDIIETSTGDFVGTGYSLKTVINGINYSGFAYKLNSTGTLQWEIEIPFRQFSAVEAANGSYIINGYTNSFGVLGSTDIVSTELNTNGIVLGRKSYGTSNGELAQEIYPTNDGGYIIGGTISENDNYNYLIIKVAANGTSEWQKTYGGEGREYLYSIAQTNDGGYILGGYSESSNSGDVTKTNKGGRDFWIVKLDASGNTEWDNLIGSDTDDIPRSIRETANGEFAVAGYTEGTNNGDIIDESNGSTDGWFVKLDANGQLIQSTPCD